MSEASIKRPVEGEHDRLLRQRIMRKKKGFRRGDIDATVFRHQAQCVDDETQLDVGQ